MIEESIVVDGVRVNYLRGGAGPAVVLVHGLIGSGRNFEQNFAALGAVRTVYALDMPVAREEGGGDLEPGLEATADRLARWAEVVGIARADWVGASHGGATVMMLAVRHPGRMGKMILFAPANPFCELGRGLIAFYNTRLGGLFAQTIPLMPKAAHRIAHRRVYGDRRKATAQSMESYSAALNAQGVAHVMGIVRVWWEDMERLRERLPEVARVPGLLVWGGKDGVVGLESGRQLAEALGAELRVVAGAGHLAFAEEAEEVNRVMVEWLRG